MENGEKVIDRIADSMGWAVTLTIGDVRIGKVYTAVEVKTGEVGVAFNFPWRTGCSAHGFTAIRPLRGKAVSDLLPFLGSPDPGESALALATVNAAVSHVIHRREDVLNGDVLERIALSAEDEVGMIGYFGPLIKPIRRAVKHLRVVDMDAGKASDVFPAAAATDVLSESSVAILSSTTLVNGTLESLLKAAVGCREVVMLGATTPLIPEAFEGTPVTWLSGVVAREPRRVLEVVSEAGGMCIFKRFVNKVNLKVERDAQ